ncbi:hypothetical protein [Nocardia sp. NPDC052112]|uniref:hypothetical protein n=1 Tax=Nocardia sp. NPDC052112 TaxID=3155646 RepID=UPI003434EC90
MVTLLACFVRDAWFEVIVLLWWLAVTAHGWILAGGPKSRQGGSWKQRLLALAVTIAVLAAIVLLRVEAARIKADIVPAQLSRLPRNDGLLRRQWYEGASLLARG